MKLMLNGKEVSGMGHYVMAGDIKDATAEDGNVLSGKVYYNNNGKRTGSMPNRGGMSAELTAGGSVSIPEGYHNGEGVVRAQDLASQTAGTASAANIEAGYTAWVNGEMVEGALEQNKSKVFDGVKSYVNYNLGVKPKDSEYYYGFLLAFTNGSFHSSYAFSFMKRGTSQEAKNCGLNNNGELMVYQQTLTSSAANAKTKVIWVTLNYDTAVP